VSGQAMEPQNQSQIDRYKELGPSTLGPWTSHIWRHDPKHLCFLLSRYKFVSKLLAGCQRVVEVGCGDAVGTPIVLQAVESVLAVDFEPLVLDDAKIRYEREQENRVSFLKHDITTAVIPDGPYDAAFSLDVVEHIPTAMEGRYIRNIAGSLGDRGIAVIGTPNVCASAYASAASQEGHVNLKSAESLRELVSGAFHNVFVFSMNDEVVHTGFSSMAHYIIALGVGPRDPQTKEGV
jgi:2-polyprenyl-3-methyl-5-hydroxy-6-metoxy-1,4-benzoquinol methylase